MSRSDTWSFYIYTALTGITGGVLMHLWWTA